MKIYLLTVIIEDCQDEDISSCTEVYISISKEVLEEKAIYFKENMGMFETLRSCEIKEIDINKLKEIKYINFLC